MATMTGNAIREALEPCPFCGAAEPRLHTNLAAAMSWVSCAACGLQAPTETGVTDDQAVAYWNRRTRTRTGAGVSAAWEALGEAMSQGDYSRSAFERIEAALRPCLSPVSVEEVDASHPTCERCQGNGEIVTDWDRYRHPRKGDVGDEAVAECPDCSGEGTHTAAGAGPMGEAVRDGIAQVLFDQHQSGTNWTDAVAGDAASFAGNLVAMARSDADAVLRHLAAHPVEKPGEVDRLTRERDADVRLLEEELGGFKELLRQANDEIEKLGKPLNAQVEPYISLHLATKARAETAEAALDATRKRLEKRDACHSRALALADELSWNLKTRNLGDRIRAALSTQESSAALAGDGKELVR